MATLEPGTKRFIVPLRLHSKSNVLASFDGLTLAWRRDFVITDQSEFVFVNPTQNEGKICLKIKLKNGSEINCTDDHKIFYKGRYIIAKDLVSLWNNLKHRERQISNSRTIWRTSYNTIKRC
jgi:hypothetical protein